MGLKTTQLVEPEGLTTGNVLGELKLAWPLPILVEAMGWEPVFRAKCPGNHPVLLHISLPQTETPWGTLPSRGGPCPHSEEAASESEGEGFPGVGHRAEGSGSQRVFRTTCQYNPKTYTTPTTQPQS